MNLIKPNWIQNQHWLDLADARPLGVMAIFWRIFANMRTKLQGGSEEIMNELQEAGFLATIYWSKSYDRMDACYSCVFGANWLVPWAP